MVWPMDKQLLKYQQINPPRFICICLPLTFVFKIFNVLIVMTLTYEHIVVLLSYRQHSHRSIVKFTESTINLRLLVNILAASRHSVCQTEIAPQYLDTNVAF